MLYCISDPSHVPSSLLATKSQPARCVYWQGWRWGLPLSLQESALLCYPYGSAPQHCWGGCSGRDAHIDRDVEMGQEKKGMMLGDFDFHMGEHLRVPWAKPFQGCVLASRIHWPQAKLSPRRTKQPLLFLCSFSLPPPSYRAAFPVGQHRSVWSSW